MRRSVLFSVFRTLQNRFIISIRRDRDETRTVWNQFYRRASICSIDAGLVEPASRFRSLNPQEVADQSDYRIQVDLAHQF